MDVDPVGFPDADPLESGTHAAAKMQAAIATPRKMILMFSPMGDLVSGEPVPCKRQMFAVVIADR
jgi:hypothetical protein